MGMLTDMLVRVARISNWTCFILGGIFGLVFIGERFANGELTALGVIREPMLGTMFIFMERTIARVMLPKELWYDKTQEKPVKRPSVKEKK